VSLSVIFRCSSRRQRRSPSSIGQCTRSNDDCIIPIVNAISRAEFDEFTTRFYEDTERMVRDRLLPPCFLLCLSLSLFASRNVDLCLTLPLPMDLHPDIYYSQYYRARLYCVSRNAFTSKTPVIQPLSFCSFLFLRFRSDPFADCHARCDLLDLISVVILTRIFIERQNMHRKKCTK